MTRFNLEAVEIDEVANYFVNRSIQLLHIGWDWSGEVMPLIVDGKVIGARTEFENSKTSKRYQSIYIFDNFTGNGYFRRIFRIFPIPIVTVPSCEIEEYLTQKNIEHLVVEGCEAFEEYQAAAKYFYGTFAERSGVHYMNHLDEGIAVLKGLDSTDEAIKAFCIHPLLQSDDELNANWLNVENFASDKTVLLLAMEYRNIANAYLSHREINKPEEIALSPISQVNDMLRADKIQNYKDFRKYHAQTHPRASELEQYFQNWFTRLSLSDEVIVDWIERLDVDARLVVTEGHRV